MKYLLFWLLPMKCLIDLTCLSIHPLKLGYKGDDVMC